MSNQLTGIKRLWGVCHYDNDNDNENMFITIDLHIYKIQDARYQYTENKLQTLFFLW